MAAATKQDSDRLSAALHHFQSALAVNKRDCEALEYAAHAHVCLKADEEAEQMLDRLLHVTRRQPKSLSRARGFRYKSQIEAARGNKRLRSRDLAKQALNALPDLHGDSRASGDRGIRGLWTNWPDCGKETKK